MSGARLAPARRGDLGRWQWSACPRDGRGGCASLVCGKEPPCSCHHGFACSGSTLASPATTPPWWSTTLAGFAPAAVPVPRSRPHRAGGGRAGRRRGGHPPGRGDRADRPGVAAGRGVLRPPRPHRAAGNRGPCAADLRRFLARHAKSNAIDAETLARLPLLAPAGLTPVGFGSRAGVAGPPGAGRGPPDRRGRPAQDPHPRARPGAGPHHPDRPERRRAQPDRPGRAGARRRPAGAAGQAARPG